MTALTMPLDVLAAGDLPLAGGKAVNLGALRRAGFPVPPGFCVTTAAFARFLADVEPDVFSDLDGLHPDDVEGVRRAAGRVRTRLRRDALPDDVATAVLQACGRLGNEGPFAVRSSATAEDLPSASFAGQHDTYLQVCGVATVLERVRDCFASLFTDRAVLYRLRQDVPHRDVAIAVVVQPMADAEVSGVLFTADPLTGHRAIAAIDASFGLGDAVVSGVVTADSYRVDTRADRIVAAHVARKRVAVRPRAAGGVVQLDVEAAQQCRPALRNDQVRALARLGRRVEAHYGSPQDIEWVLAGGTFTVTQARPITTLYPLPSPRPDDDALHAYASFGHLQVMTDPMPPLVTSLWREILPVGRPPGGGPSRFMTAAGGRLYVDVSMALRHPVVGRLAPRLVRIGDRLVAGALAEVRRRPSFRARGHRLRLRRLAVRVAPYAARVVRALVASAPEGATTTVSSLVDHHLAGVEAAVTSAADPAAKLAVCDAEVRRLFTVPSRWLPDAVAGMLALSMLRRLLAGEGADEDLAAVQRGLSGNVVTEMDLAVADLADAARSSPGVLAQLERADTPVSDRLAAIESAGTATAFLAAWRGFLGRYGARANGEIDLSRPRWADDPTPLAQMVCSAARHGEPGSLRARYDRLGADGVAAGARLVAVAGHGRWGRLRGPLVRRLVRVARNLLPLREHHKYLFMRVLALLRGVVIDAGQQLYGDGRLAAADDVWFLTMPELRMALAGQGGDLAACAGPRREALARHRQLRPPRVMTSDGETVTAPPDDGGAPDGALAGSAASPGTAEGVARVVTDPATATLHPGEILVTPFTDPGWTPLFVSAAGLVTEVGGAMTHGSLVAREYGIPAVVGVVDATRRIRTGQRLRVHGDAGYVELLDA